MSKMIANSRFSLTGNGSPTPQPQRYTPQQPPLKKAYSAPIEVETQETFVQRFVPEMVVERLFKGGAIQAQELSRYQEAVVGFFDVSGFSSLARDLEQTDRTRSERALKKRSASTYFAQHSISGKGAEELVRQLNETLSVLIETIRAAGGDIIKFAGDAILVVWLCEDSSLESQLLRASQCALACTALKSDQSKLGLHVGIGCGELVACHVGGTFGRWEFFIAGDSCTQSALAESHAGINQVVLSPQARELAEKSKLLSSPLDGCGVDDGFFLLNKIHVKDLGPVPKPKYFLSSDSNVAKAAEGYVPGPVRDALKSGGSSSASVGGLRKLTVIFFKLYDVVLPTKFDTESEKRFLEQCQNQAKLVQDSAYHYYATLRQFILDDKGFVAIVALGLPPFFHEDNAVRALKVAKRLIEHHKIRATAGICTGTVFCGVVGSTQRAEYSIAGSCINLAARLMAKASPGAIWCDTTTKMEAESLGHITFEQFPSLTFKGFDQPVDIFGPVMSENSSSSPISLPVDGQVTDLASSAQVASDVPLLDKRKDPQASRTICREDSGQLRKKKIPKALKMATGSMTLVGMDNELINLARACFLGTPAVRACFVEGDAGSGKTRLVEWVLKETGAKRIIISSADSSETNTPFFVWRSILQAILAITRQSTYGSFIADQQLNKNTTGSSEKSQQNLTMPVSTSRKRGLSFEFISHNPPPPAHRRNPSAERIAASFAMAPIHNRSQSASSLPSDITPLQREANSNQFNDTSSHVSREDSFRHVKELTSASEEESTESDQEGEEREHPGSMVPPLPPKRSSIHRASADSILTSPSHSRRSSLILGNQQMPERPAILENLHDSGKLRGKRLSSLHAIIPNLVIPSDLDSSSEVDTPSSFPTASGVSQQVLSASALLSAKLVGHSTQRRSSFTSKAPPPTSTPQLSSHGSIQSSQAAPGEPVSEAQQSMELMLLLLEECGVLSTTQIVIENAQFMDKQSWELLRRCCEMSPPTWKGEHRVRFVVTYRPFPAPREHPLQMILQGPLRKISSTGSMISMNNAVSTPNISTLSSVVGLNTSTASPAPALPVANGNISPADPGINLSAMTGEASRSNAPFDRVSSAISSITNHASRRRSIEHVSMQSQVGRIASSEAKSTTEAQPPSEEEPNAIKITISPLTQREAGVFLSNVHHVAVGPRLLEFLYKRSKGNPRALLDFFKMLQDQDLITVDPASGTVEEMTSLEDVGDLVFVIPHHLRAQLQQQFDKLMNREQLILKLASVIGSSIPLSLLKTLYIDRVSQMGSNSPMGVMEEVQTEEAIDNEFEHGIKELRERGFIRPFLHWHNSPSDDGNDEADVPNAVQSVSIQDQDEDWIFESDHVRFLVYSQMLHTARKEIHGLVLDWYLSKPTRVRIREDPSVLGNHAVGAERHLVAFQCFREGLRRVVLRNEAQTKGARLWQSCVDLLDDPSTDFSEDLALAYRIEINVFMAEVCIMNEQWDEAKHYLHKAMDLAPKIPTMSTGMRGSHSVRGQPSPNVYTMFCFPLERFLRGKSGAQSSGSSKTLSFRRTSGIFGSGNLTEQRPAGNDWSRDPLVEVFVDPVVEAKSSVSLARALLKKIEDIQDSYARMISGLKKFSLKETASRN